MSEASPVSNCPFYGLHAHPDVLVLSGTGGNGCALRVEAFSPCRMERDDAEEPNWPNCTYFNVKEFSGLVQAMRDKYRVWIPGSGVALFESRFLEHGGRELTP